MKLDSLSSQFSLMLGPALAAAALLSPSIAAQELKRTELKNQQVEEIQRAAVKPQANQDRPNPGPLRVVYGVREMALGDEPDFVPSVDVHHKDGRVEVRRVGNPYTLAFMNGNYTPPRGLDPDLVRSAAAQPEGYTYGFVMIRGRMSEEKMQRLRQLGLKLLGVHTYQSVKAKIPSASLAALGNLDFVHWVGYARTSQKIGHNLASILAAAKDTDVLEIVVNPFESDLNKNSKTVKVGKYDVHLTVDAETAPVEQVIPNGVFHRRLTGLGFEFVRYSPIVHAFVGKATKAQVLAMLGQDWVHSVEIDPGEMKPMHDQSMAMIQQDYVRNTYGGKGVAIGMIEGGFGTAPYHNDHAKKSYALFGALTQDSHGTHVAGTIWGDGTQDSRYKGAAPLAGTGGATDRIFISAGHTTSITAFSKDFTDSNGKISPYPRVINGSYATGISASGWSGTELGAREVDTGTYNKKQLYVYAAGNQGSTTNRWSHSPGSAKNGLTVGSVVDEWSKASNRNPGDLSTFSRFGVTDLRTKPEVVAPGQTVTSTKVGSKTEYANASGTSMAAPHVTGSVASLIQSKPTYKDKPELLKAIAVASAKNSGGIGAGTRLAPQSGSSLRQATGWGMIDCRAMVFKNTATELHVATGTFKKTGDNAFAEFSLPSDAVAARLVLCFTEQAASATATKARINDIEGFLDLNPISASVSSGDYSAVSGVQTTLVANVFAIPAAAKGKKARIKAYARSVVRGEARWAAVVIVYRKNPNSPTTNIAVSGSLIARPNANMRVGFGHIAKAGQADFHNQRLWVSGTGFVAQGIERTTLDNIKQVYDSQNKHVSANFPQVALGGESGIGVGSGSSRWATFLLRAPGTNGIHGLNVGTRGFAPAGKVNVCVDGTTPNPMSGVVSTSHSVNTWSNSSSIAFKWNAPTDRGCAGLEGMSWALNNFSVFSPTKVEQTGAPTTASLTAPNGGAQYFHIRSKDKAGNYSVVAHLGPYRVDTTTPTVTSFTVNGGAAYTTSLNLKAAVGASDSFSGVKDMQFWGGVAGAWIPFAASSTVDFSKIGETTTTGLKDVWVRVRDRAGNISGWRKTTITMVNKPSITSVTGSLNNMTKGFFTIKGSNLTGLTSISFGSNTITRSWTSVHEDDWWFGRIRVINDTTAYLYPPQAKAPGSYGVRVTNLAGTSNALSATTQSAPLGQLLTSNVVTAGKPHYAAISQGTMPNTAQTVVMISWSNKPSIIPNFINMSIGNNWTEYLLGPYLPFASNLKLAGSVGPTPKFLKGQKLYFQAAYLQNPPPLKTTGVVTTTYR